MVYYSPMTCEICGKIDADKRGIVVEDLDNTENTEPAVMCSWECAQRWIEREMKK